MVTNNPQTHKLKSAHSHHKCQITTQKLMIIRGDALRQNTPESEECVVSDISGWC